MPTGADYAKEALKVLDYEPKAGYIYATMNRLWSEADQVALEKKYSLNPEKYAHLKIDVDCGSRWIGHRVFDAMGLIKHCGRKNGLIFHHDINQSFKYDCRCSGAITKGMALPVGAWVYSGNSKGKHHVGIVVDDGWVVEALGTKSGVVRSKLSLAKWTYWGLARDIAFDFVPGSDL